MFIFRQRELILGYISWASAFTLHDIILWWHGGGVDSTLTWFETQSHTVRNPVFGFPATKTCMFRSIGDSKCHVIVFVAPTFFVLSMAFSMDMFRSSKAARTFSYSPRCWEKYSSQPRHPKKKKEENILWVKAVGQGCGCFVEAALVWHLGHTASRGLITELVTVSNMLPSLSWENVK